VYGMRQWFLAAKRLLIARRKKTARPEAPEANAGAGVEVTAIRLIRLSETHQGRYGTEVH